MIIIPLFMLFSNVLKSLSFPTLELIGQISHLTLSGTHLLTPRAGSSFDCLSVIRRTYAHTGRFYDDVERTRRAVAALGFPYTHSSVENSENSRPPAALIATRSCHDPQHSL
jgi:hypothetical protein